MRRFLLYVHTGRRAALNAMLSVLEELRLRGVRAIVVEQQIDEILALPEDRAPPRLLTWAPRSSGVPIALATNREAMVR